MRRTTAVTLSSKLLYQCRLLLAELDAFHAALTIRFRKHQQQQHIVEMRQLRSNVIAELKTLERQAAEAKAAAAAAAAATTATTTRRGRTAAKLAIESGKSSTISEGKNDKNDSYDDKEEEKEEEEKEEEEEEDIVDSERRLLHALRSSNLSFYTTVWTIAKERCTGVTAFGKRFYWDSHNETVIEDADTRAIRRLNKDKRKSVFVDIVCDDGEEWVKVSTLSENRLLFEIAEKGWDMDDDDEKEAEEEEKDDVLFSEAEDTERNGINPRHQRRTILRNSVPDDSDEDDDDQIELVKVASDLVKAAKATRIRYRHPRIRFIIPKLVEGKITEIDHVLKAIRSYGVNVECGIPIPDVINDEMDGDGDPNSVSAKDLPLSRLLLNAFDRFTDTVNVDCTLLLALVSDLSHIRHLPQSPSYHRAINRQIEIENEQPLVPTELWPAMTARYLICTQEAVKRMREIVDTIGTDTEKARTALLLGDRAAQDLSREELLRQFQQLSDHEVPIQWLIPIEVIDAQSVINAGWKNGTLPPVAHRVSEYLSDINRSVFLSGWAKGIVTITSNKTVARQIENTIEENRYGDDYLEGPQMWVCDTARSLIGKERNRKA